MKQAFLSPSAISWTLAIIALVGAVVQFAYNRWESVFLLFNKAVFFIRNPSSLWDVEIDCRGEFTKEDFKKAFDQIRKHWPNAKKHTDEATKVVIQAEGILLKLSLQEVLPDPTPNQCYRYFNIHFSDVRASYHESRELVDSLARLTELLVRRLKPHDVDYNATIQFSKTNPYFGLYARRLSPEQVEAFNCILTPSTNGSGEGPQGTVVIGKNQISVSSRNQSDWSRLSKKYLAVR